MYQLRSSCAGNVAARRPTSGYPTAGGRNDALGGTDMITAFAKGLSGIAASPAPAMAPQSCPMITSRPVAPAASSTRSASSISAPTW